MAAGNYEAGVQALNFEQLVWLALISSKLSARSSLFPTRSSVSSDVDFVDADGCVLPCQQQGQIKRHRYPQCAYWRHSPRPRLPGGRV